MHGVPFFGPPDTQIYVKIGTNLLSTIIILYVHFYLSKPSPPARPGVVDAQLIFNWCHFEWEIEGNYGVWDDDFRFEIYSMGITKIAMASIRVDVDFQPTASKDEKNYFRQCLTLAERIQVRAALVNLNRSF